MTESRDNNEAPQKSALQEPNRKVSRRKFFVRASLGSIGVLALGTYVFRNPLRRAAMHAAETMVIPYSGRGNEANLWFEITQDNRVTFYSPKVEMGQGTFTGLAQIAADELDVRVDQIDVQAASTDTGVVDAMSTGGSLSVSGLWQPLRELAATMREMIKLAAAEQLAVSVDGLTTAEGQVTTGNRTRSYAEIAAAVSEWEVPTTPALRPVKAYKSVGQPVARIDLAAKVFGDPIFGLDAEMPDMLHATVIRPEHVAARLKSVDATAAEQMPGVVKILENDDWVAVIAESFPQALSARRKVSVDWEVPKKWTEREVREMLQVGKGDRMVTQQHGAELEPDGAGVESMEFTSPLGAHAQIEPNGAVAHVKDGKATVVLSTQVIGITQKQVAEALGFPLESVNIVPTYLGGGFGRRLNTSHAIRTAQMSQAVGRPVKYVFTRKEEFQHDLFRPPTHHVLRGKLNSDGLLDALEHHYASGDVAIGSLLFPAVVHSILGADLGALRGANIQYDLVPNHRTIQWHTTLPFATSWWRSLGLLANTFAIESFVDEMALKAGRDPVDFRLRQISDQRSGKRLKDVIRKAADAAGYRDQAVGDRALGFAASIDGNSPCAQVAEVSIEGDAIVVHRVTCAFDCGLAVNPDQVRAQCEGSIIMGMSGAMHEKMSLMDGQLLPTIYGPYDMALMRHAPRQIDVHLIQGADHPLPVGEPPVGPIGAAVANAVRRLTGQRLTDLPLRLS